MATEGCERNYESRLKKGNYSSHAAVAYPR